MNPVAVRPYLPALIHVLVWLTLGIIQMILHPLSWNVPLPLQFWVMQGIIFSTFVGLFYLNALVLAPRFLFGNKIWLFIFLALASGVLAFKLITTTSEWLNVPELIHKAFNPNGNYQQFLRRRRGSLGAPGQPGSIFVTIMILLILFISTSVAAVQKWRQDTKIRQDLEQEKINSELSFLKAQINPHFFFNTLNNIYSLTMFNIEAAREALHTLSRMMRYVLYETKSDTIPLSKEIAFVQDYIDLMKLRLTDKIRVTFDSPLPLQEVAIAPMLLLPFVENAFKYGISTTSPGHIYIGIRQQARRLEIEVRNTLFTEERVNLEESSGIGLVNTRRRLDLLYPNRYQLSVMEHSPENEFRVSLVLEL